MSRKIKTIKGHVWGFTINSYAFRFGNRAGTKSFLIHFNPDLHEKLLKELQEKDLDFTIEISHPKADRYYLEGVLDFTPQKNEQKTNS